MPDIKQLRSYHYNVAQLRLELWNTLKSQSIKLKNCNRGASEEKDLKKSLHLLLKELESVESYFAFPGGSCLHGLNEMLDRQEHTALAHKVAEITKHLVSDRYRSNPDFIEEDEVIPVVDE
jgi:arginine decarboxylase